ncbi:hypothetical protein D3273_23205 [Lichenibacterium minor]|uniref:Uncharacterized protein n=1 Tax=Lichenibacterium minor TaxID=2316528 RepID=A0A4Q2TZP1_9HYPH|nr:hypothetical protein [Lichenibacterium minor]RYC29609.1 hypothetical protein D3273_23205 [Lichenibacterium minor]
MGFHSNISPAQEQEPPEQGPCRRLLHDITTTRIDRSGARLKVIALTSAAAFGLVDGKLIKLGLSGPSPASPEAATGRPTAVLPDINAAGTDATVDLEPAGPILHSGRA